MFLPYTKFRINRLVHRLKKLLKRPFRKTRTFFRKTVINRWDNFREARQFIFAWMGLVLVLVAGVSGQTFVQFETTQKTVPVPGGRYVEGVVGETSNLNPLFAIDGVNADAAQLMFSSLVEYGSNGQLGGDLAKTWKANKATDEFTVKLRNDAVWHDGTPLTAEDVVFTLNLIQNPDTRSPLMETWVGVDVTATDDHTIVFKLPNPFAPFPHLMRFGILPKHLLGDVAPAGIRTADFNSSPIGSGPFKFAALSKDPRSLLLQKFDGYFGGTPNINRIELRSFQTAKHAQDALERGEIDGVGSEGLINTEENLSSLTVNKARTSAGTYVFFNTREGVLANRKVRLALTHAIDHGQLARDQDSVSPSLRGPFLQDQLLFSDEQQVTFSPEEARRILSDDGWKQTESGVLAKKGTNLAFSLSVPDTVMAKNIAGSLVESWDEIGAKATIETVAPEDFQVEVALPFDFESALITITNGIDPDVFVYWHSSSASQGGLNFSGIKDDDIDTALESGRTRTDPKLRRAKYKTFAGRWRKLAPAAGIQQNLFTYIQKSRVSGFNKTVLSEPSERFNNIENWTVLQERRELERIGR